MRIKDILATTASFVATAGPALARAGAPIESQNDMFGGSSLLIIALMVALGIGIYFVVKDDNDPDSP